jgi:hypothetical protein
MYLLSVPQFITTPSITMLQLRESRWCDMSTKFTIGDFTRQYGSLGVAYYNSPFPAVRYSEIPVET